MAKTMDQDIIKLKAALNQNLEELVERWMPLAMRYSWHLRRETPKLFQLKNRCHVFLEALRKALDGVEVLEVGGAELREPVQLLSFAAGWMAGERFPIGSAVALVFALQEILGSVALPFFHSLNIVVSEAYAAGVEQKARSYHRDVIEKSQVVCLLEVDLPCLFLVGDPDRQALDDAIGRLMMMVVMRDAFALIVDVSGLFTQEKTLSLLFPILRDHSNERKPRIMLSGITPTLAKSLGENASIPSVSMHEELLDAMAEFRTLPR
ncbi:MAG: hypothetical protein V1754_11410 [Pseudomonadota bacterium]